MARYGYARVSTKTQTTDTQRTELVRAGIDEEHIITEVESSRKARQRLHDLLAELREGDELWVVRLDRLARSGRELDEIASSLSARGIALGFNGRLYNPHDPMDRLFFQMLGVFAEFERNLIASRTQERLTSKRDSGERVGRPRCTSDKQEVIISQACAAGHSYAEVARATGVSKSTVQAVVKRCRDAEAFDLDPTIRRIARDQAVVDRKARDRQLRKLADSFKAAAES